MIQQLFGTTYTITPEQKLIFPIQKTVYRPEMENISIKT